jgi:TPR repeat protein
MAMSSGDTFREKEFDAKVKEANAVASRAIDKMNAANARQTKENERRAAEIAEEERNKPKGVAAVLGAVSTGMAQSAARPGVDPKSAEAMRSAAATAKGASDVARFVEAVTDSRQAVSAATAGTRQEACAQAEASVSPKGPCAGPPAQRRVSECTCQTVGSGSGRAYTCHVEVTYACESAAKAPPSGVGSGASPATSPVAPAAARSAGPATLTIGEATNALHPSPANLPGALSDPTCEANQDCRRFQKQCNTTALVGCAMLANIYQSGLMGVAKDLTKAATLRGVECDSDPKGPGCIMLANLYLQGTGVPQSKDRAKALARRSCDAGLAGGCSVVASLGDAKYGNDRLKSLCDAGDSMACAYLAGVPAEKARAIGRLNAICAGGDQTACAVVKAIP